MPGGKQRSHHSEVVRLRPRHDHYVSRISTTTDSSVPTKMADDVDLVGRRAARGSAWEGGRRWRRRGSVWHPGPGRG